MKKILYIVLLFIILAIVTAVSYVKFALPNIDIPSDIKVTESQVNIKHGEYLAYSVAACMDCHSSRDWTRFAGPIKNGTMGMGGEYFGPEMGFPGKFYSKNITPANLSNWTDGEIFRTITSGVDKNGKPIFPVMPYPNYGKMDRNDVLDIIAYIRTLPSIENTTPTHEVDFPMSLILNTIPKRASLSTRPPLSDTIKYGGYLVNMAACLDCHTQVDKGKLILDKAFSGGREFEFPNGITRSANITPDKNTGIGNWDVIFFIERFKAFSHPESTPILKEGEINTIMPWTMYAGMEVSDLKAIFTYLKSLKPIENKVIHFSEK